MVQNGYKNWLFHMKTKVSLKYFVNNCRLLETMLIGKFKNGF